MNESNNNSRLRRSITQFLNSQTRGYKNSTSYRHLNEQFNSLKQEISSYNEDIVTASNKYYEAVEEGNETLADQYRNDLRQAKERKREAKERQRDVQDSIEELENISRNIEEQGELNRQSNDDLLSGIEQSIQTMGIANMSNKMSESVDSLYDVIKESSNTLGLDSESRRALSDSIYENTKAINKDLGKSLLSVNDTADELSAVIEAGMTDTKKIADIVPLLAEGNKLLGLNGDQLADYATKFQDSPEDIQKLYDIMASGKMMDGEYKDYALQAYQPFTEQLNELTNVMYTLKGKGVDIGNVEAQLLALNSTMNKNSIGEFKYADLMNDVMSKNNSELASQYGNQIVPYADRIRQGDISGLQDLMQGAITSARSGTPEEAWSQMYGDLFDYNEMKNSNAKIEDIMADMQTYQNQYMSSTDDSMKQIADNYHQSLPEQFWNYFTSLPIAQALTGFLGDMDLNWSTLALGGIGIKKVLGWLGGSGASAGGAGLFSNIASKIGGLFGGAGTTASTATAGAEVAGAGASVAGGSGLLAGLGTTLSKVAPWLSIGTSAVSGVSGLYKGVTSEDSEESTRGYTSAGLNLGGAGVGALIGSIVPGVGTLLGAGIGAGVGGITDWLAGDKISDSFSGKEGDTASKEGTTSSEDSTQTNLNSSDILTNVYGLLSEWYNLYKNGSREKAKTESTYAQFTDDGVTADMTATSTSNLSGFASMPDIEQGNMGSTGSASGAGADFLPPTVDGSHKNGLDTVPKDGYIAELHKNEAVLTKKDADVWRANKSKNSAIKNNSKNSLSLIDKIASDEIIKQASANYEEFASAFKNVGSNGTSTGGNGINTSMGSGVFPKYTLTDRQVLGIAHVVEGEQSGVEGHNAEASLMANLTDIGGDAKATTENLIAKVTGGWFANGKNRYNNPGNPAQTAIDAVKSVLVQGKRTLPRYVNEHDCFSDLSSVTNNGRAISKTDRGSYRQFVTKIKNRYGASGTFYTFPNAGSDPFYYTSEENRQKYGENHYAQGTPYVPEDQVAVVHEGEMIVPKANNPLANGVKVPTNTDKDESNNTSINNAEAIRELQNIVKTLQQGIQYLGKKIDSQENSPTINIQQGKGSNLTNLKQLFTVNQL